MVAIKGYKNKGKVNITPNKYFELMLNHLLAKLTGNCSNKVTKILVRCPIIWLGYQRLSPKSFNILQNQSAPSKAMPLQHNDAYIMLKTDNMIKIADKIKFIFVLKKLE